MKGTFIWVLDVARIPVAIGVLVILAGLHFSGGEDEFARVVNLIASGIVLNGAVALAAIWAWRKHRARAVAKGEL
jgi:protein-S-isoprenylcysteine O-methyltransferase Ste14